MKKANKEEQEYKKNITMIEVLAILISLIILLLLGVRRLKLVSYEITYNGLNCPTPYVIFYSDNTYKYYQYYGEEGKAMPYEKGDYSYDINNVIENIDKYEEDEHGPYTIKVSTGEEYTTYSTNNELMSLFDDANIDLNKCMTSKDE